MPVGTIHEHVLACGNITFHLHAIPLRNAYIVLITDHETGTPGLGSLAIGTPTALKEIPVVASALPSSDFKHGILSRSITEVMSRKLGKPVFTFMDVTFEANDAQIGKCLRVGINEFCGKIMDGLGRGPNQGK